MPGGADAMPNRQRHVGHVSSTQRGTRGRGRFHASALNVPGTDPTVGRDVQHAVDLGAVDTVTIASTRSSTCRYCAGGSSSVRMDPTWRSRSRHAARQTVGHDHGRAQHREPRRVHGSPFERPSFEFGSLHGERELGVGPHGGVLGERDGIVGPRAVDHRGGQHEHVTQSARPPRLEHAGRNVEVVGGAVERHRVDRESTGEMYQRIGAREQILPAERARGRLRIVATLPRRSETVDDRSTGTTSWPSSRSRSATRDPMKPAAPVTTTFTGWGSRTRATFWRCTLLRCPHERRRSTRRRRSVRLTALLRRSVPHDVVRTQPSMGHRARQIATTVATEGSSESNVDPSVRIAIEQLGRVADLHVANAVRAEHQRRRPHARNNPGDPHGMGAENARLLQALARGTVRFAVLQSHGAARGNGL